MFGEGVVIQKRTQREVVMQGFLDSADWEDMGNAPDGGCAFGMAIVTFQRVNLGKVTYANARW